MKPIITLEWLNTEPIDLELSEGKDGSVYMGIDVIKPKLKELDPAWGTTNFRSKYFSPAAHSLWWSGSVELHVQFTLTIGTPVDGYETEPFVKRTIVGAATFNTQDYFDHIDNKGGNTNWDAVGLSLCIVNAAKNIGPSFGMNLNKGLEEFLNKEVETTEVNDKLKNTLNKLSKDIKGKW